MKKNRVSPANWRGMLAVSALVLSVAPLLLPSTAQAAPKRMLELWPGQRVLLVLPLEIGPNWNAGPELAQALKPVVEPLLQPALTNTGKFSVTLPYRFDPILRRAVADNRIPQDTVTALVNTPSLETAQAVLSPLVFEQVPMVTQIQLEELRVGGTQEKPTVQLQVSGKLYEVGGNGPFRSVVVTSQPFEGRTPEARLQAAAADAFKELAAQFVKPPEEFQLPLPPPPPPAETDAAGAAMPGTQAVAPGKAPAGKAPAGKVPAGKAPTPATPAPATMPPANSPVGTPPPMTPNTLAPGAPLIPQLPPAQPPLGVAVTAEPTMAH